MKYLWTLLIISSSLLSCTYEKAEVPQKEDTCDSIISYTQDIRPILDNSCIGCHSGGFSPGDYSDYAGIKSKVDNGTLKLHIVTLRDMPPPPETITDAERKIIKCWVEQGGPNN